MHCVSSYPTKEENLNLRMIYTLKKKFNCEVGYSGHERGINVCLAAVARGAKIIERHFTLDKNMEGYDNYKYLFYYKNYDKYEKYLSKYKNMPFRQFTEKFYANE